MTRLSVNINKVALIRNARGENQPNLLQVARDCESFGAQGITVHPRPDQRHVRYDDIPALRAVCRSEFNVEGNPTENFLALVGAHPPHQCTLVPDAPDALTSDAGWDTLKHRDFLKAVIARLQAQGIRCSIFIGTDKRLIEGAKAVGADRIEFYTGPYARQYGEDPAAAVRPYAECARFANSIGLGVNAGHDLNLHNLRHFVQEVPEVLEVSIGHALICDALYLGMEETIARYLECLS